MNLLTFQRTFQAAILKEGEACERDLEFVAKPHLTDCATAFGVYYNAYRMRMAEFLSTDFPILRSHLGDERFGRLVEDYIAKPSSHRNARWYASGLPEFMERSEVWREDRDACDLARFERALANAFDAADAPILNAAMLNQIDAAQWPNLAFSFHPGVILLDLAPGTAARYAALAEGCEADSGASACPHEVVLVWRQEYETFHRFVDEDERLALIEAMRGKTFADVCTLLSFRHNGEDLSLSIAGFLSAWFADGLIIGLQVKE